MIPQADIPSAGPAVTSTEEHIADLVLSLIFRKGQLPEPVPSSESIAKTIANFSRRHLISGTVLSALPNSHLPAETIAALTDLMRQRGEDQNALHRQLCFAISEIQPALAQEGIRWRLIKGPRLQYDYYGPLAREYFDLDIVVPKDQFAGARRVLARLGWNPHKRGLIPLTLVRPFEHGLGLKRGEVLVDLHWSLRVRPAYRIDEHRVFAPARTLDYAGINVPVLDSEYDLTICLLSIAHGIERNRVVLRDAIDLYTILISVDAIICWETFFQERHREGTKGICVSLLADAVFWLDEKNYLANLRRELGKMECLRLSTEVNHLKNCICLKNAKETGWRWYLSVYHGGKSLYWLHKSLSVIFNQEFPYNLHRTFLFRRFMR
jgi:hypothetical protein